ncbi:MAG: winged helix-turn-helix domain-containing protein [Rhodothermales bacterium]
MPLLDQDFYIDQWHIQPMLNRVAGPMGTTQLEPRLMRVLVCLAEQQGAVVEREALLDRVWSDVEVTEGSLTHAVSVLRKLFGDEPNAPRIIETIRGRGYRLLMPVRYTAASDGAGLLPELVLPEAPAQHAVPVASPRSPVWVWGLGGVMLIAVSLGIWALTRASTSPPAYRIEPLTSFGGTELFPAFSPDGQTVAFVWFSPEGQPADIYVKQQGAGAPVRLTDQRGAELMPAWSPDGTEIAFFSNTGSACGLYRVPSRGGASQKVLDTSCWLNNLAWSPDGRALVASTAPSGGEAYRLVRIPLDTRVPHDLTAPPAHLPGDMTPRFSPDGTQLGFLRYMRGSVSDLFVLGLTEDGQARPGSLRRITADNVNLSGFDWASDGASFVIASNRDAMTGFWRVANAAGATPNLIRTVTVNDPGGVALSRTSPHLAYIDWTYDVNIHRVALGQPEASPSPIVVSSRSEMGPQLSPDGTRLTFVSNRSGYREVWVSAADGQDAVQLTTLRHPTLTTPRWSPDGRQLAFVSAHEGNAEVYLIDADGGVPQRLTRHPAQDMAPQWAADGAAIHVWSDRADAWHVWRIPLDKTQAPQRLVPYAMRRAEVGADGTLYATLPDSTGLWAIDLDSQQMRQVLSARLAQWTTTAEAVYFIASTRSGAPLDVQRYDIETRAITTVASIPADPLSPGVPWGFDVSDDEQWLVYSHTDRAESDILLVDGFK